MKELLLAEIAPSQDNPRRGFDKQKMAEMVESIKEKGILEPIIVRPVDGAPKYRIVCGERRYKAAAEAKLKTIPAIIRELSDEEAMEIRAIENLQREDLNAIDEARGFQDLIKKCRYGQEDLSSRVSKSPSYIAGRLRLLDLPKDIQDGIVNETISPGHGAVLLRLEGPKEQQDLYRLIVRNKMSIRVAENELEQFGRQLSAAPFDKKICLTCNFNGNKQANLFDKDTTLKGRCLNAKCFAMKMNAYVIKKITELKKDKKRVLKEQQFNSIPEYQKNRTQNIYTAQYGGTREPLKEHYKAKCKSCPSLIYVIRQPGSYGENIGIQKIEEVCIDSLCYNRLVRPAAGSGSGEPRSSADMMKRMGENQALEAKQRFWKLHAKKYAKLETVAATVLYGLLDYCSKYGRLDFVPKTAITRTSYGMELVSLIKISSLSLTEIKDLTRKAVDQIVEKKLDDDDLKFACAKAGYLAGKHYVIDKDFLQVKRKVQLVKLAKEIGLDKYLKAKKICEPGKLIDKKKGELIDFFLKKGFELKGKIPKEMQKEIKC